MAYHRQQGVDTSIVRIFNTYGPRMRPNDGRAIPNFMSQALAEKPLTVYGDGSQTRSFCYVDDLIRGLVLLAESGEHLPVNIGNPERDTRSSSSRRRSSPQPGRPARSSSSRCPSTTLRCASRTSRAPDRSSAGSPRSRSTRASAGRWPRSGGGNGTCVGRGDGRRARGRRRRRPRSDRVGLVVAADRHLRRRRGAVRRARPRLPAAPEDEDAAPPREPVVVRPRDQRRDPQAEATRGPERSRLQLGHLRPDRALLDRQRDRPDLLDHRDAAWANAAKGWNVAPTKRAISRTSPPPRRSATADVRQRGRCRSSAREPLDGVERAQQPRLPEAAVPPGGHDLDDPVGPRLREDVQRRRPGDQVGQRRRRSRAARPGRGGTTTRTRAARRCRRSRSSAP